MSSALLTWGSIAAVLLITGAIILWVERATVRAFRNRLRRAGRRALLDFQARIARHKLVQRRVIRDELILDPVVVEAMRAHCREHHLPEPEVRRRVEQYIFEIVPFFSVLSYYKLGYNVSRILLRLLYHVSVEHADQRSLDAIPRRDVVVYVMNHRSNADYVLVAYVLARGVSISYAVGEWARVWPLEYIFKTFGAYFVRRGFREPLYHTVLERYVQLITRHGVVQGVFPEGGLSRDGHLRPPKLGLLDYVCRTVLDPAFDRDIWFVPVGINYDRVLEDRSLIRELVDKDDRPGRLGQLASVGHYVLWNTFRLLTGRLRRYGRAAVTFGTPLSLKSWLAEAPAGALGWPKEKRLAALDRLAHDLTDRIAAIVPVTPVPLAAAALLSFEQTAIPKADVLDRMDEYRDHLKELNAKVVRGGQPISAIWDRAWRMLKMRRLVVQDRETLVILPRHRPLLEYYANSIVHLLPVVERPMHKVHEADTTLPRLKAEEKGERRGL
ncbi:MAG: 1-acyl-sn-glycerol-3-phosphate acyltransferase [Gemmatimonadales bacterium]